MDVAFWLGSEETTSANDFRFAPSSGYPAQVLSSWRAKIGKPAPHALVGNIQAPLRKQILDVSIAQSEAGIEPNGMANDARGKSVALKADVVHLDRLPQMPLLVLTVNVAMPCRITSFKGISRTAGTG